MNMLRAGIVLLSGLLLSGCTGITAVHSTCDELVTLRTQIARAGSLEQFRTWIADTYQITPESIELHSVPPQMHLLLWHRDDQWYSMSIENGVVAEIGAQIRGLSATDVITCLGQPGQYKATYGYETPGGTQLDFALLFPDQGILAGGAKILRARPTQPPAITGDFKLDGFQFMPPGPVSTLLEQAHSVYAAPLREQMINAYKPWPDAWQDITIGKSWNVISP